MSGTARIALVALAMALASPARASEREALEIHPTVDVPLTLGTGALFLTLFLTPHRQATLSEEAQVVGAPRGLDALGVLELREGIAGVSDVLLFGGLALGAGAVAFDGGRHRRLGARLLLYTEALVLTGALTELAKWAVRRPRPYTFSERLGVPDDDLSFFSGHTSMSAAWVFTTVRLLDLTHRWPAWLRWLGYGGATLFTASMATMRVLAGKHWPTDVLVGGAVGAAAGLLVPELHRRDLPVQVALAPARGGGRIVAAVTF